MPADFTHISTILHEYGIAFFPCGRQAGKKPLCSWGPYQKNLVSLETLKEWQTKFPHENVGIVTGEINNLTVLDCDDPSVTIEELQNKYGKSNLIVKTPSGGHHLYYCYNKNVKTHANSNTKIDIRSEGGYVISPKSQNPRSKKTYEIVKGGFSNIKNLTKFKDFKITPEEVCGIARNEAYHKISKGGRNNALFKAVKDKAVYISTEYELYAFAESFNNTAMQTPLPLSEVRSTVKKCWEYKTQGRLLVSGQSAYFISNHNFHDLSDCPSALALYIYIHKKNCGVRDEFLIIQDEVAKLLNWKDRRQVANNIKTLIARGKIKRIHKSKGQNDGHRYIFT